MAARTAARYAIGYALLGALWIILSDRVLALFSRDAAFITHVQTYKGWFFIAASAGLLFLFLRREFLRRGSVEAELTQLASFPRLSPNPILEVDFSGRVTYCNPGARRILAAENINDPAAFLPAEFAAIAGAGRRGEEREWVCQVTAGTRVFTERIFIMQATRVVRIYGYEITEQQRLFAAAQQHSEELESRVRERTVELQTVNKELEAFSYSVSHDLRAPLRSISGFSQALLEDFGAALSEDAMLHVSRIRAATLQMEELIDDLLLLARVTRSGINRTTVDLSRLAETCIEQLRRAEPDRAVTVAIQPGMNVNGDARLLRIMLENLLGNAWKFTGSTDSAIIEMGMDLQGTERVYFVRDNGVGFDPRYAEKLFVPFQRLHTRDQFPGTGIGLATVQRIVHRHGGTIRATGAPGEGAAFYFTLH